MLTSVMDLLSNDSNVCSKRGFQTAFYPWTYLCKCTDYKFLQC